MWPERLSNNLYYDNTFVILSISLRRKSLSTSIYRQVTLGLDQQPRLSSESDYCSVIRAYYWNRCCRSIWHRWWTHAPGFFDASRVSTLPIVCDVVSTSCEVGQILVLKGHKVTMSVSFLCPHRCFVLMNSWRLIPRCFVALITVVNWAARYR